MNARTLDGVLPSPVIVAPMGGGPSRPALVVAAAKANALGFLAAGYKRPSDLRAEIDAVRAETSAPFGVNVFVPGQPCHRRDELQDYLDSLAEDLKSVGALAGPAEWDDDDWGDKVSLLVATAPAVVSFTFGVPGSDVVRALKDAGSLVMVTVTSLAEARVATEIGADALCAQGIEAGAHRGTFTNDAPAASGAGVLALLDEIATESSLPLVGAGAVMDAHDVRDALAHGAVAVQCGTAFLRCPESGASQPHKDALADDHFRATDMTRAFSGRPARGLVNSFMLEHGDAPSAYPEINNATRPMRAAATRSGDLQHMSLWAGTGFRRSEAVPVADVVANLTGERD